MIIVAANLRTSVKHESLQTCPTSKAFTSASACGSCELSLSWLQQAGLTAVKEGRQIWVQRATVFRQVLLGLQG